MSRGVYWGKSDDVALDVLRGFPRRVGYTVANFSVAMRNAGLHRVDAARRPVVSSAYVAAVQSEMIEPSVTRAARAAGREILAWTVRRSGEDSSRRESRRRRHRDGQTELATATVRAMRQMCGGGGGTVTSREAEEERWVSRGGGASGRASGAERGERSDASLSRSRDDSQARARWEGRRTSTRCDTVARADANVGVVSPACSSQLGVFIVAAARGSVQIFLASSETRNPSPAISRDPSLRVPPPGRRLFFFASFFAFLRSALCRLSSSSSSSAMATRLLKSACPMASPPPFFACATRTSP